MAVQEATFPLLEEIAELLASDPTPEKILQYRPSPAVQEHVRDLLHKSNAGELTADEERELTQFEQVELLMRLLKARLRSALG